MQFEVLSKNHLKQLLEFEFENKEWFESLIEPREIDFYSEKGVAAHIQNQIESMNSGVAYCGVLIKNNIIIGRGNLKQICSGNASIGYRISKQFVSQGCASYCLSELIKIAQDKFSIKILEAQVLDNNSASKRVLEKQGFILVEHKPNFITINNSQQGCSKFCKVYV